MNRPGLLVRLPDHPLGHRQDADFSRFPSKRSTMIYRHAGLRLPLVHHLVEHRVLDLSPWMACDVPPAQGYFRRLTSAVVDRELTKTPFHPVRDPNRDRRKGVPEVLPIERAMQLLQPVD
jgi:hypothetical protein